MEDFKILRERLKILDERIEKLSQKLVRSQEERECELRAFCQKKMAEGWTEFTLSARGKGDSDSYLEFLISPDVLIWEDFKNEQDREYWLSQLPDEEKIFIRSRDWSAWSGECC